MTTEQAHQEVTLALAEGQYEIQIQDNGEFRALENGYRIRELHGNQVISLMVKELIELRKLQEMVTNCLPGDSTAKQRCQHFAEYIYSTYNPNRY